MQRFPAGKIPLGGEWLHLLRVDAGLADERRAHRYPRIAAPCAVAQHEGLRRLPRPAGGVSQADRPGDRAHEARDGRRLDAAGRADAQGPSADRAAMGRRRRRRARSTSPSRISPRASPPPIARGSRAGARKAILESVIPALKDLHKFISETYLPACRQEIAASGLPGGPDYYRAQIRWLTTTDLSPAADPRDRETRSGADPRRDGRRHQADGLFGIAPGIPASSCAPTRDLPACRRTRCFRDSAISPSASIPSCRSSSPSSRALPTASARSPLTGVRRPPIIRRVPLTAPAPATSTPTRFKVSTKPRHEMEALFLHEAVPGHHLQVARAQELKRLARIPPQWPCTTPTSKAGHSTPRASAKTWASTKTRTRSSAGSTARSTAPAAWWSTPACTPWAGARDQAIAYMKANTGLSDTLHRRRNRPLHRLARPGARLQARRAQNQGAARQGQQGARRQVRHPQVPQRVDRRRPAAAGRARTTDRRVDRDAALDRLRSTRAAFCAKSICRIDWAWAGSCLPAFLMR